MTFNHEICFYIISIYCIFRKATEKTVVSEVPNRVQILRDQLSKQQLSKYKAKRKDYHAHKAAAQIWARGVPWVDAIQMVESAFNAVTFEE